MKSRSLTIWMFVFAIILSQMVGVANAVNTYWVDGTGDWFNVANWDPKVPEVHDNAYIDNNIGIAQITAGDAQAKDIYVGHSYGNSGKIDHKGGTDTADRILLGLNFGSEGTYKLSGTGSLQTTSQYIGSYGTGTFNHIDGNNSALNISVGADGGGIGAYNLKGGELGAFYEYIGNYGTGTFVQSGGTNTVDGTLALGRYTGSNGTYTISGGTLEAQQMQVGVEGTGHFFIDEPAVPIAIEVYGKLTFGWDSEFKAKDGSTIRMDSASFDNVNIDETDLSDLINLTLVFTGGEAAGYSNFEVAGTTGGGFSENFAHGELILGNSEEPGDVGLVQLVDNWNNGNRGDGDECLFVLDLIINDGSKLDVYGLTLYEAGNTEEELDRWIKDGRLWDSTPRLLDAVYVPAGDWTVVVPEPATLLLLGLGGLALRLRSGQALRRKRRAK